MKNIMIMMFVLLVSAATALAAYTYTVRFDATSEEGVIYIGKTSTDTKDADENKAQWMITRVTSSNITHSAGTAFMFNQIWANRLTVVYK